MMTLRTETPRMVTAAKALGAFEIDGYTPFMDDPITPSGLLTEAHGLTQLLAVAFVDSGRMLSKGGESDLNTLNPSFIASALNGVGSLIALALALREQEA